MFKRKKEKPKKTITELRMELNWVKKTLADINNGESKNKEEIARLATFLNKMEKSMSKTLIKARIIMALVLSVIFVSIVYNLNGLLIALNMVCFGIVFMAFVRLICSFENLKSMEASVKNMLK